MKKIEGWQVRKIYAIANALKYVDQQDKENDILHMLLWQTANKTSVKELTYKQAEVVIAYLEKQQGRIATNNVSQGQIKKIWSLMYELKKNDVEPNDTPLGERLAGIICRQFGIKATPQRLFTSLSRADANQLIEILKHYIDNAEMNHTSSRWMS